jgi:hypothetical protein
MLSVITRKRKKKKNMKIYIKGNERWGKNGEIIKERDKLKLFQT